MINNILLCLISAFVETLAVANLYIFQLAKIHFFGHNIIFRIKILSYFCGLKQLFTRIIRFSCSDRPACSLPCHCISLVFRKITINL